MKASYEEKSRDYFGAVKMEVVKALLEDDVGALLDVGGGDGGTSRYLLEHGRAKSALILDPHHASEDQPPLAFSRVSADDQDALKSLPQTFDTVFFLDVLEHLLDPWETLKSVRHALRDGGRLVVCMPNARFIALTVPLVVKGRFDYKPAGIMDRTHLRWFTRATTIELVEGAGFRVDKVTSVLEPRVRLANSLTLGLFRPFLDYQYVVQATKID
ncbi:MAG: methyltransferase domain-containing protein [Pseudomonadota bacterium]